MKASEPFITQWQSPSNIALVKYWGKKGFQLPSNASISFTLDACHTTTRLAATPGDLHLSIRVNGKEQPSFLPKIEQFFKHISELFPALKNFNYSIDTSNTFPHSSGIASSASGMSALALCVVDLLADLNEESFSPELASNLARIGSGSACRSVYGGLAEWGKHANFTGSSDEYAIPFTGYDEVFNSFHDDILIVHEGSKSVSSTVGHSLLNGHAFATQRFEEAEKNMSRMKAILHSGDLDDFVDLVEREALMLHALMMTSTPSFILMKPETVAIIDAIRADRIEKGHHICFTLDAGANVHMLYPEKDAHYANELITSKLVDYCENGRYIRDRIGRGPKRIHA